MDQKANVGFCGTPAQRERKRRTSLSESLVDDLIAIRNLFQSSLLTEYPAPNAIALRSTGRPREGVTTSTYHDPLTGKHARVGNLPGLAIFE